MGDPAGVGPEIAVRCAAARAVGAREPRGPGETDLALVGDPGVLEEAARRFAPALRLRRVQGPGEARGRRDGVPLLTSSSLEFKSLQLGCPSAEGGTAALAAVRLAVDACRVGQADALVTAPLSKEAVELGGEPFTGHTEWIARRCGQDEAMMLMSSPELVVGYATTHLPLGAVPAALTQGRILCCLRLMKEYLAASGRAARIGVCGLNPHAGEGGLLGHEDDAVIRPAVDDAHAQGIEVQGPLPADTIFVPNLRARFGGILAMYHDQGGIPFKMLSFETGVNITLGLDIVRTSVDHGTAWDIAWKGLASARSLECAILEAERIVRHKIKHRVGQNAKR